MSKYFVRSGRLKVANSPRQAVELKFNGYREVDAKDVSGLTLDSSDAETSLAADQAAHEDTFAEEQTWETNGGAVADVAPAETPKPSARKSREN